MFGVVVWRKEGMKSKQNPPGAGEAGLLCGGLSGTWAGPSHLPNLSVLMAQSTDPHPLSSPLKAQIYLEIQNFVFSRIYSVYSIITPADSGAVLYDRTN